MPVVVSLVVNRLNAALTSVKKIVIVQVNAKMRTSLVSKLVERPSLCVVIHVQRRAMHPSHAQRTQPVRPC